MVEPWELLIAMLAGFVVGMLWPLAFPAHARWVRHAMNALTVVFTWIGFAL